MARYHINSKGEPGVCKARKACPFGDLEKDHYETKEAAREAFEQDMELMASASPSLRKHSPREWDAGVDDYRNRPYGGVEDYEINPALDAVFFATTFRPADKFREEHGVSLTRLSDMVTKVDKPEQVERIISSPLYHLGTAPSLMAPVLNASLSNPALSKKGYDKIVNEVLVPPGDYEKYLTPEDHKAKVELASMLLEDSRTSFVQRTKLRRTYGEFWR